MAIWIRRVGGRGSEGQGRRKKKIVAIKWLSGDQTHGPSCILIALANQQSFFTGKQR